MGTAIQESFKIDKLRRYMMLCIIAVIYIKFIVIAVLDQSNIIIDILLYQLLLFTINYRRFSRTTFFLIIALACLSVGNSAARNLFLIFLCFSLFKELSIRYLVKANLVMLLVVFIICTLFLLFGITKSAMFEQSLLDMRERWDYGMRNPNRFALFVYSIILNVYLLFGQKYKIIIFVTLLITMIVYNYTQSRTFVIAVILLIILHYIRFIISRSTLMKFFLQVSPILLLLIVFYISFNVDSFPEIDLLLTGRPKLYNYFLNSISLSNYVLGASSINEEMMDSAYLHLFFEGGVLIYLYYCYIFYKAMSNASIDDLRACMPVFFSILALGLTESVFTFVLMFGNMIIWQILFKLFRREPVYKDLYP